MLSEQVAKLQTDYTDKYVVVDASRPELARFKEHVGLVKTVNMSGRALVQFQDFHQDTGWHDIELEHLKVVSKPASKEVQKAKPAVSTRPAATQKKLSPLEMARMQGAGKKKEQKEQKESPSKKPAGKRSVADILAAARAGKSDATARPERESESAAAAAEPAAAGPAKADRAKMSVADMIAAARTGKAAPKVTAEAAAAAAAAPSPKEQLPPSPAGATAKPDRAKMSVADMIAAARTEKTAAGSTPAAEPVLDSAAEPAGESTAEPAGESAGEAASSAASSAASEAASEAASSAETGAGGGADEETLPPEPVSAETPAAAAAPAKVDRSTMSVADMVAWCRQHDGSA